MQKEYTSFDYTRRKSTMYSEDAFVKMKIVVVDTEYQDTELDKSPLEESFDLETTQAGN
jgi:hypothetical protein